MKTLVRLSVIALLIAVPFSAIAQKKDEEKKLGYVYATYFQCDTSQEWKADAIAENVFAPIYNAAVDDGTIMAWGWMAHHTGGHWRRILYRVSPTLEGTLDAQKTISKRVQEAAGKMADELGAVCSSHDDYIWQQMVGSKTRERGAAAFSVYLECEQAGEDRADEIMEKVLAPIYNEYVGEGKLTSWGWARHIVGGEYRRLSTMSAADFKTILKIRGDIIERLSAADAPAEAKEFWSICDGHVDYMWDIKQEKP